MSVGNNLQEMESVVTKGAKSAEPMQKAPNYVPDNGSIEDLGGPTPQNYKADDNSAQLKTPTKTVGSNVVTKGAKSADPMPKAPNYVPDAGKGSGGYTTGSGKGKTRVEEADTEGEVVSEEDTTGDFDIDISEDINAMFSGEDLSEEFKNKAATIFEAAVRAKVNELAEEIEQSYVEAAALEISSIKEQLTDRIDSYLEYVAEEWIKENALQIENGIKAEMSESFIQGMKGLFEDHYVSIPEDKYDVLEAMSLKLDEMETKLNEQIEQNVYLYGRLNESVRYEIVAELSRGLAESQRDKLASLAEGVEFESEEQFREKISMIRESYFSGGTVSQISEQAMEPSMSEVSDTMSAYLRALGKYSGK